MNLRGIFNNQSSFFKLMLLIFFIAFLGLMGTLSVTMLAIIDLNIGFSNMNELMDFSDPDKLQWLKIIQVVSQISMFLIPALLTSYLISSSTSQYLHLSNKPLINYMLLTILLIIFSIPIINLLADLNNKIVLPEVANNLEEWFRSKEDAAQQAAESFLKMESFSSLLFNIFMIGIVAAISEELLFRGIMQNLFASLTKNIHAAIWITAIIFSAVHMQFYGFIPRMLLGAMLGYMLLWSGSIWIPIFAHFIHNTTVVVSIYLIDKLNYPIDQDTIGIKPEHLPMIIASTVLVTFILFYMYKNRTDNLIYATNKNGPVLDTDPNLLS